MDTRNGWSKAWDQANPWDNNRTWKNPTGNNNTPSKPDYRNYVNDQTATNNAADAARQKEMDALQRSLTASQNALAAQPKLIKYDTSAAWARAQASSESKWNPVYQDKLNQYLQGYNLKKTKYQTDNTRTKDDLTTNLQQLVDDNNMDRTRTGQDTASKIAESQYQEGKFQTQEGDAFDQAVRALRGDVADSGLTTSGIGQQVEDKATTNRNATSADQVRTFDNQRQTAEMFKTRKFEDLSKSDTRSTQKTGLDKQRADEDLNYYIDTLDQDKNVFQTGNEVDRISKINESTGGAYDSEVAKFIASLIGSGARAQDIQLASQIYGRR